MKKLSALTLAGIGLLLVASPVYSQSFIDFQSGGTLVVGNSLTGTVTYEGWNNLTTARIPNNNATGGPEAGGTSTRPYGNHNNTAGWYLWAWDEGTETYINTGVRSTIASNLGAGTSTLWKSSGYGYVAGSSIHQGFPGFTIAPAGNFTLTGSAITGLENVIFQIQATNRDGEIFAALPTLTIGSTTLDADYFSLFAKIENYSTGGFGDQDMDFYAFQWDLSGLSISEGDSFSINWTGLANSGIFGMQLNQGDTFLQVVPEPSTWLLLGLGLTIFLIMRRRRANACADA